MNKIDDKKQTSRINRIKEALKLIKLSGSNFSYPKHSFSVEINDGWCKRIEKTGEKIIGLTKSNHSITTKELVERIGGTVKRIE